MTISRLSRDVKEIEPPTQCAHLLPCARAHLHAHPVSKRSQAPVGHCSGYSMVTAETGVQRPRPRSRARSCPLLLLTDITCASPHFTRVHGWYACSHSAALISSRS